MMKTLPLDFQNNILENTILYFIHCISSYIKTDMKNILFLLVIVIILFSSCKTTKKTTEDSFKTLDPITVIGKRKEYKGSHLRTFDLINTKLKVNFSWEDQYLFGEANLTLKPYFYPQSILELDAKGMDLRQVSILNGENKQDLDYNYDGKIIKIKLDKTYTREDKLNIFIKYVSKPNELEKAKGLSAISDNKGLYFINPLGEDKDKPRQIWTQGEPEDNSVWFPTIDHPNERTSMELSMTVEENFYAISNGYIEEKVTNGDGTYTITWKQDKPIAPYLVMMAIGEYAEVKDSWRGMTVNYYVEKEYENVARKIFGKTPEMIEFFSEQLGVEYPWDKYWSIIVRDYVSGAMENTSAVIFGEFLQKDERELLDGNNEDIVAHELYHHWFGDLVTCESWANLPLNESFATYGEVLWKEHEYGNDEKLLKIKQDMKGYFREANSGKQVDMIRFNYEKARDMFDGHSYAKGGVILNMLRETVGDDAFFTSLQNYLWANKFQSVEIHDLRIAFEKTTGKDLNWFFNQWFLSAGHPIIDINYEYTDSSVIVQLEQRPSKEEYLVYKLPLAIDIIEGYNTRRENIIFDRKKQSFEFKTNIKPQLVNVDAKKYLLAEINDSKTEDNYVIQFNNATHFLDKLEALNYFAEKEVKSLKAKQLFNKALDDDFWYIQQKALSFIDVKDIDKSTVTKIVNLAENSSKTSVQAEAYYLLANIEDSKYEQVFEKGIQSKSYKVNAAALDALASTNPTRALEIAKSWESINNYDITEEILYVYSEKGDTSKIDYFKNTSLNSDNQYIRLNAIYFYSKFLGRMDDKTVLNGVSFIENWGKTDEGDYSKRVAQSSLIRISNTYVIKADSYKSEINNSKGLLSSQKEALENEYANILLIIDRINEAAENLTE